MRIRTSFCMLLLSTLLYVAIPGCAGKSDGSSRHQSAPNTRPATTRPSSATGHDEIPATRSVVQSSHPSAKTHFWFTYTFKPPGRRDWVRVADKKWEERWETGEVIPYTEGKRFAEGDIKGLIVTRDDGSLEVLIPDAGKGAMVQFRDPAKINPLWSPLGAIEGFE